MKAYQAFRYELKPKNVQRTLLARHAGAARFAYNWGLARRIEAFNKNEGKAKFTNATEQHRELVALKKGELSWLYAVRKAAPQEALRDLDRAFRNFWKLRKSGHKVGFPRFRKKGKDDRFRLTGCIRIEDEWHVLLPRIGKIRVKESTSKFRGRILSATVSGEADRWFVSFCVEAEREDPYLVAGPVVGIDLGLSKFAVLSDGAECEAPKPLQRSLERLRRLSRAHSRKRKGSNNRRKSARKLARLYVRIRNVRADWIHKATTRLAKTKSVIVVEDLSVRTMIRHRWLSRSIADAGWGEFRRQLEYKARWYGSELVVAPRDFPSTRRCSRCAFVNPCFDLSRRVFVCQGCGFTLGRDLNAARNLQWYGQFGRNLTPVQTPLAAESATESTSYVSLKQEGSTACPRSGING